MDLDLLGKCKLISMADLFNDLVGAGCLVCQFSAWSVEVSMFRGDHDPITYLKVAFRR